MGFAHKFIESYTQLLLPNICKLPLNVLFISIVKNSFIYLQITTKL